MYFVSDVAHYTLQILESNVAITEEDVFAAATELDAAGTRPTQKAVRERLGGGSFTTIAAAMQRWHQRRAVPVATRIPLPESLSDAMSELLQRVWDCAVSEMDLRLRDERRALRDAHATHQQELADHLEALATLQAEHDATLAALEEQAQRVHSLELAHREALDHAIAAGARHAECSEALTEEREARREAQRALESHLSADYASNPRRQGRKARS